MRVEIHRVDSEASDLIPKNLEFRNRFEVPGAAGRSLQGDEAGKRHHPTRLPENVKFDGFREQVVVSAPTKNFAQKIDRSSRCVEREVQSIPPATMKRTPPSTSDVIRAARSVISSAWHHVQPGQTPRRRPVAPSRPETFVLASEPADGGGVNDRCRVCRAR